MKKLTAVIIAIVMIFSLSGCGGVSLNFSGVSPFRNLRDEGLVARLDTKFGEFCAEKGDPDISVGVIWERETRFLNSGMDEHTVMNVGTVSTVFPGMLVSNMELLRYIGYDEYVDEWIHLPSPATVPGQDGQRLKVWQLACGLSGLGDVDDMGKGCFTSGMMYNKLEDAEFTGEMGKTYKPSAMGSALLGECLRQSYNMNADFVNLMNNQVVSKMELNDSRFAKRDALAAYDGFESTSYDLLKLVGYCGGMLTCDENLTKTMAGALEQRWEDGENYLSMSFDIDYNICDHTVYFKQADTGEGQVYIAFCPDLQVGVSLLSRENCDLTKLGESLIELMTYWSHNN